MASAPPEGFKQDGHARGTSRVAGTEDREVRSILELTQLTRCPTSGSPGRSKNKISEMKNSSFSELSLLERPLSFVTMLMSEICAGDNGCGQGSLSCSGICDYRLVSENERL